MGDSAALALKKSNMTSKEMKPFAKGTLFRTIRAVSLIVDSKPSIVMTCDAGTIMLFIKSDINSYWNDDIFFVAGHFITTPHRSLNSYAELI